MRKLWIAFAVLATYVSIYPFDFDLRSVDSESWTAFLGSWRSMSSRGDILGNVVLFGPFGVLGMLAGRGRSATLRRFLFVCGIGFLFAAALQVIQLYLPSRDENLQDVLWNVLGTAVGAGIAALARFYQSTSAEHARGIRLVPCALLAGWLVYRLIPFVPSIDLQSFKDSLKPLLLVPELGFVGLLRDTAAWLVVAYLLRYCQRGRSLSRYLPLVVAGTLVGEVLIVHNRVSATNLLGGVVALVGWFAWLRHVRRPSGPLAWLLLGTLVVSGLAPFELREQPVPFSWLPFKGYLSGSMWLNAQSACEKLFYYGSVVYLLGRTSFDSLVATAIGFMVVLFVEVSQVFFAGHSPEITDPLLIIAAALAIVAVGKQKEVVAGNPPSTGA